jgi:hypothetical protein
VRDLRDLTPPELLVMHAAVSEELRRRGVIRSSSNPVGDLAEHLFCRAFGWKQAPNSMRDAEATDAAEVRYQIKGRRLTPHNNSRQLGALRELPPKALMCSLRFCSRKIIEFSGLHSSRTRVSSIWLSVSNAPTAGASCFATPSGRCPVTAM